MKTNMTPGEYRLFERLVKALEGIEQSLEYFANSTAEKEEVSFTQEETDDDTC